MKKDNDNEKRRSMIELVGKIIDLVTKIIHIISKITDVM